MLYTKLKAMDATGRERLRERPASESAAESVDAREERLCRRRERERERHAAESADAREERLRRRRERERELHSTETAEQGKIRLSNSRIRHQMRLASETPEEVLSRRLQGRTAQQRWLASESPDERELRLQQLSVAQQRRLDSESAEERESRLQQVRVAQQLRVRPQSVLSTFNPHRPIIHSKMKSFHSRLLALEASKCATCLENFPGLSVSAVSCDTNNVECIRCKQDKHVPKLYSFANNMDPGCLPTQLQVCSHINILHYHPPLSTSACMLCILSFLG